MVYQDLVYQKKAERARVNSCRFCMKAEGMVSYSSSNRCDMKKSVRMARMVDLESEDIDLAHGHCRKSIGMAVGSHAGAAVLPDGNGSFEKTGL